MWIASASSQSRWSSAWWCRAADLQKAGAHAATPVTVSPAAEGPLPFGRADCRNALHLAVHHMQSAFLLFRRFPPPATGADILAGLHGARARRAADARVVLVVQLVVGHLVGAQIDPHLALAPVGQRAELDEVVGLVVSLGLQAAARRRLGFAQAGDPGLLAGQHTLQRLDLAGVAAGLARLDRVVEAVDALPGDRLRQQIVARIDNLDAATIAGFGGGDQGMGLLRQAAGIEREDADIESLAEDHVGQHHVFGAEAVGKHRRCEVTGDVAQQTPDVGGFFGNGVDQFTVGKVGQVFAQHGRLLTDKFHAARRRNSGSGWSLAA